MDIFVSAGEASSDIHTAQLVAELKKRVQEKGETLNTFGLGGDCLASQGTVLMMHNSEFSVGGGPLEVISKLPKRRQLERMLERRLFEKRPDGAILADNGEINLRLASLLHFFDVPVVYYIPPKVWTWRLSRIEDIAQHVDLVLSILPFEEPLYKEWEIPFQFVGNPLLDEVPLELTQTQARQKLGLDATQEVLTVLVGSRHNEVRFHTELFAEGVRKFLETLPEGQKKPVIVLPAAQAVEPEALAQGFRARLGDAAEVRSFKGQSHACMKAARAALVKSGTSTLEAALLGTPMVLAYATSRSAEWVYKHVVRYRGFVGLVNLFLVDPPEAALGWTDAMPKPVVEELILRQCTPENIARELKRVYFDGADRERMQAQLAKTKDRLLPPRELGDSPSGAAARASLELFERFCRQGAGGASGV